MQRRLCQRQIKNQFVQAKRKHQHPHARRSLSTLNKRHHQAKEKTGRFDHRLAVEPDRKRKEDSLSGLAFRSGAITEVITDGAADFVAADFAGHSNAATTQAYYNKAGDAQRFVVASALTAGLLS